ncbi:MAG TPA: alpha/beta fold hydrolase [Thermoleophilaceae bacterium]
MVSIRTGEFTHDGFRLVYSDYGSGAKPLVLVPGLLLPRSMHDPLARTLAERGNRVITLDPLGHGESDRPADMWRYTMALLAEQVVGLMDHLELDEAVVGGTSLGANVTLETCVLIPDRVRGAVIEMPVLDNALLGCALAFAPLLVYLTVGLPVARTVSAVMRRLPRTPSPLLNVGLDWAGQDPKPSGAYLQGLFFGRTAPPRWERSVLETRALVIGHPRDPVHPFSDADMLVREMRNSRMIEASSILELRLNPARLTGEIGRFLDECWREPVSASPARRRSRRAAAS